MGQRGPQRHSQSDLAMRGSWRARRPPPTRVELPAADASPGQYLSEVAKHQWDQLAPMLIDLGCLTVADKQGLACYCEAYARWCMARDTIHRDGCFYTAASGMMAKHPAVTTMETAASEMRFWGSEFGLTPKSRTRLELQEPQQDPAEALHALLENDGGQAAEGNARGR